MNEFEFPWTQDSRGVEAKVQKRQVSRRNARLYWLSVIAMAVVAYANEAGLCVAVTLGCVNFGWDEFCLARWLKRTDPDQRRGRTCSLFYLAWGVSRIILASIAIMFLVAGFQSWLESKPQNVARTDSPPPAFISAGIVVIFGLLFLSVLSTLAVISGLRNRVQIWIGPEARWAREENVWPPQAVCRRRATTNQTKIILLSAMITLFGIGTTIVLILMVILSIGRTLSSGFLVGLTLLTPVVGVISILVLLDTLGARMIASTPEACWTDPPEILRRGS
jgi:hypothetical protein